MKILIVEDEEVLVKVLQEKFEKENFIVKLVTDGELVFELVKSFKPDLILLDIMLPGGMNGFDVLEQLKSDEKFKSIPVFVVTNLDSEEKTARTIGAADYIVKANTSIEVLVNKIKDYLS